MPIDAEPPGLPEGVTVTSREFNQDTARSKRAAAKGPVFVTTRGKVSHVLMTKQEFDRLGSSGPSQANSGKTRNSPADALADASPEGDFDFAVPEFKGRFEGAGFD